MDYNPLSTIVTFEKDVLIQKVRVQVLDNQVVQQSRKFSATIEVMSGLQFPVQVMDSNATIQIEDDDSMYNAIHSYFLSHNEVLLNEVFSHNDTKCYIQQEVSCS